MFRIILSFLVLSLISLPNLSHAKEFVTIGTGGVTGVYYPTGGAIAKIINGKRKYGIRASAESTGGSVYNINAIRSGNLQFGIAQSDRQFQAVNGLAEWKKTGPQKDLRAICSLHREAVTLVAADDAKINSLKDFKGKRINIGNPGSGQRGNAIDILNTAGLNWDKDFYAESLNPAEAPMMLQDSRIDAFFYTVGHPSGAITEATSGKRKVHFVSIEGMDRLLAKYPYYGKTTIPAKLYPNASNKTDASTIGVMATLVTSSKVSDDVVYAITKELFENLDTFKTMHPAFAQLEKKGMLEGLSAPLHPGALRYYKEAGLIK
jgi:uncharacterized protein